MIISQTPFRISLSGGGTDFEDYYLNKGAIIYSGAINKYLYVTVNKRFDGKIHLRYSKIEEVSIIDELQHDIVKAALKLLGIKYGIEIVTISDIPSKGSGLGSSSALTVGVLNALHMYIGKSVTQLELAEMACYIEIQLLKSPIGKQDQTACALGGFNQIEFTPNGDTICTSCDDRKIQFLESNLLLFYLGYTRNANNILKEHKYNISNGGVYYLDEIKRLSLTFGQWLKNKIDFSNVPANIINQSWEFKKKMSNGYTNKDIDKVIKSICSINNNIGAKCCGAGGGGFLLVYSPPKFHNAIKSTLAKNLLELKFNFSKEGSRIIYANGI